MRRTLLLALTALLMLSGLGVAEEASVTIKGRLKTAGPSIYMEGSHELFDAKDELIGRLSGLEHKVNLDQREGQWVSLVGYWKPTVEGGGKIFEVQSLTQAEETSEAKSGCEGGCSCGTADKTKTKDQKQKP